MAVYCAGVYNDGKNEERTHKNFHIYEHDYRNVQNKNDK